MVGSLAIFGSCVTRDAFEIGAGPKRSHDIAVYLARTTINSCLSPPPPFKNLFDSERRNKFEDRCVIADIFKLHFSLLRTKRFDHLLIDLIDERHPILIAGESSLCYSVPFSRMAEAMKLDTGKFERRLPRDKRVVDATLANIPAFLERLRAIVAPERTVLHEALWAPRYRAADGEIRDFANQREIQAANEILRSYYAKIRAECPAMRSIRLDEEHQLADEKHRWTLEPFHYAESYYAAFRTALAALDLPGAADVPDLRRAAPGG
jgi:hypothetical protein